MVHSHPELCALFPVCGAADGVLVSPHPASLINTREVSQVKTRQRQKRQRQRKQGQRQRPEAEER